MSDTNNLTNSIWPNGVQVDSDGYAVFYPLGTNKTAIPSNAEDWPNGSKLISPFVYDENNNLVGFCDTKAMTANSGTTITMPYEYIEANFASIEEGSVTVNAPNAAVKKFTWAVSTGGDESFDFVIIDFNTTDSETINTVRTAKRVVDNKLYDADGGLIGTWDSSKIEVGGIFDLESMTMDGLFCNMDLMTMGERGLILSEFNSDLSSLRDGENMFCYCSELESFSSDLSSLTDGEYMFGGCTNLTTFNCNNLSKMTNGESMFSGCSNLTSFSSDLSSLTDGNGMFVFCYNLTAFNADLSSLTNGGFMFQDCHSLTSFSSDLSSLTDGETMFGACTNLTSFTSDLSSLTNGNGMFSGCKLDASSVKNIIDTINTYSDYLPIGMGCNDTTEDSNLFAQEVGYADMTSLLAALQAKRWTVEAQFNGRPTTTYGLKRTTEPTLPVFVKLEEVEETTDKFKSFHTHTSLDGTKKYRLSWFHETTGSTEGYTQFNSLDEAIEALNIKPIERN